MMWRSYDDDFMKKRCEDELMSYEVYEDDPTNMAALKGPPELPQRMWPMLMMLL